MITKYNLFIQKMFKQNSRFAALGESLIPAMSSQDDTGFQVVRSKNRSSYSNQPSQENKSSKLDTKYSYPYGNRYSNSNSNNRSVEPPKKINYLETASFPMLQNELPTATNPDLSSLSQTKKTISPTSFASKLKKQKQKQQQTDAALVDETPVMPGWIRLTGTKSNDIQVKYGEGIDNKVVEPETKQEVELSDEMVEDVSGNIENNNTKYKNMLTNLLNVHKRRTQEYIELWGKEEWSKNFLFKEEDGDSDISSSYDY
jgi:hypothetical protein